MEPRHDNGITDRSDNQRRRVHGLGTPLQNKAAIQTARGDTASSAIIPGLSEPMANRSLPPSGFRPLFLVECQRFANSICRWTRNNHPMKTRNKTVELVASAATELCRSSSAVSARSQVIPVFADRFARVELPRQDCGNTQVMDPVQKSERQSHVALIHQDQEVNTQYLRSLSHLHNTPPPSSHTQQVGLPRVLTLGIIAGC